MESSSGNSYYDQSAIRAIRKASPVPPLPKELGEESLDVGIKFRYPE
jgi:TonB family protein